MTELKLSGARHSVNYVAKALALKLGISEEDAEHLIRQKGYQIYSPKTQFIMPAGFDSLEFASPPDGNNSEVLHPNVARAIFEEYGITREFILNSETGEEKAFKKAAPELVGSAKRPNIYISYAWGDETPEGRQRDEIVDQLCETLTESGFAVGRDKTHTRAGDSIQEFTQKISKANRIIAVISEKYLYSNYCMVHELFPVYRRCDFDNKEFQQKVIALVLGDSLPMLSDTIALVKHWAAKATERRDELMKTDPNRNFSDEWDLVNKIDEMCPKLPNMLGVINDTIMTRGFNEIRKNQFVDVLERLKSDQEG
jgi:hypothetical protein